MIASVETTPCPGGAVSDMNDQSIFHFRLFVFVRYVTRTSLGKIAESQFQMRHARAGAWETI
jgi:hypothetical protein